MDKSLIQLGVVSEYTRESLLLSINELKQREYAQPRNFMEFKVQCMYECMYVCIYVCMYVCMYICMYLYMLYVYMYICMCTYVCMYVSIYVHTYVCMYICIYVCMYVYNTIYVCMYVCVYVPMYMYVCMYNNYVCISHLGSKQRRCSTSNTYLQDISSSDISIPLYDALL